MAEDDYINNPLKKLEELEQKTAHENKIVISRIDTFSAQRLSKRTERRRDNINLIGIYLMWLFAGCVFLFVSLIFATGLFSIYLPDTSGFRALDDLFTNVVANSKTIMLIVLGYFFRDYAAELYDSARR